MRKVIVALKVLAAAVFGWHIGAPALFFVLQKLGVLELISYLPEAVSLKAVGAYQATDVRALVYLSSIPITSVLFFRLVLREGKEGLGKFIGSLVLAVIATPIAWLLLYLVLIYLVNAIGQAANKYFWWDTGRLPGWLHVYIFNTICLVIYYALSQPNLQPEKEDNSWKNW